MSQVTGHIQGSSVVQSPGQREVHSVVDHLSTVDDVDLVEPSRVFENLDKESPIALVIVDSVETWGMKKRYFLKY